MLPKPSEEEQVMSTRALVLIVRVILGIAGGWALAYFFFNGSLLVAAILAALVILAAYASEAWRLRKTK